MKTLQALTAVWLAAVVGSTAFVSANAAPSYVPQAIQNAQKSDVIQIRDGVRWRHGYRNYRPGYRYRYNNYNNGWYPAGAFVAGALIGGAIANSYDYDPYYGDRYYGGYREPYYQRRVYQAAPGSAYRQGYRDGYRAGRSDRYYGGYPCSPRLADSGRC
jgi:hypothetical protein